MKLFAKLAASVLVILLCLSACGKADNDDVSAGGEIQKPSISKVVTEENPRLPEKYESTETSGESATDETTQTTTELSPQKIKLISVPLRMASGTSTKIEYKVYPEGCKGQVTFTSSDDKVISVSGNKLTAEKSGRAVITAKIGNIKAKAEITVYTNAEKIEFSDNEVKLTLGESETLEYKVSPRAAKTTGVSFSSSNSNIVTVNKNGVVTAKSVGTADITVKALNGGVTAVCRVTVEPIHVKTLNLDETKVTLGEGQKYILYAVASPSNATFRDLKWSSSDNSVVTVNNGYITAKSVGTAVITVSTDRGEKTKTCKIKVQETAPDNPVYYMKSTYNVRNIPGSSGEIIAKAKIRERVELLCTGGSDWMKVRTQNGTVGYILSDKSILSSVKPVFISGVPYINQFKIGLPTGCEDVAATMVMQYHGYKVNPEQMIKATPMGKGKFQKDGVWYAANPFEEFVGDPHKRVKEGSYGCFSKPIVKAMNTFAGGRAKNISGCDESLLYDYVKKGKPVVVWGVRDGKPTEQGVTWKYVDNFGNVIGGEFKELVHEHCFVLIGYDDTNVYLNDPAAGAGAVQKKSNFSRNWKKLYKQAIVIE